MNSDQFPSWKTKDGWQSLGVGNGIDWHSMHEIVDYWEITDVENTAKFIRCGPAILKAKFQEAKWN